MNFSSTSNFRAAFFVTLLLSMPAHGTDPIPLVEIQSEILPDGNIRDPAPTEDELKEFAATIRKNMVFMKGGTFEMGDWGSEVNESGLPFDGNYDSKPLHKVTLSSFYIGKYPVTYAEFDIFTAARRLPRINQSSFAKRYRKPDNPAGVTWQGAKDYCQWLAQLTGERFDLPTEAQWEYAARSGGKRHLYPTDNGNVEEGRNLPSYEQEKAAGGLVSVSRFPPNQAGIHYMSAGVQEYTNDWYDPQYYEKSPAINPPGPAMGTARVMRGFAGTYLSAMTFNRWPAKQTDRTGKWILYATSPEQKDREIPYTKYSGRADAAFRCVSNEERYPM
jgi:formylglycine-generating enzyme required for sulfatase activity